MKVGHLLLRDWILVSHIVSSRRQYSLSISPALIWSLISFGLEPSTWQPTEKAVPKISRTVPFNSLAKLLKRIVLAISMISSRGMFLLCLMFFSFFRSRGGSLSALMMRDEAEGTTETAACRFWIVSLTVTRSPFQSPVALAMSSPTFLGDRPRGPILGASVAEAPTSPPVARRWMILISLGSNLGAT